MIMFSWIKNSRLESERDFNLKWTVRKFDWWANPINHICESNQGNCFSFNPYRQTTWFIRQANININPVFCCLLSTFLFLLTDPNLLFYFYLRNFLSWDQSPSMMPEKKKNPNRALLIIIMPSSSELKTLHQLTEFN